MRLPGITTALLTRAWPTVAVRELRGAAHRLQFTVLKAGMPLLGAIPLFTVLAVIRSSHRQSGRPVGLELFAAVSMASLWVGLAVCPPAVRQQLREAAKSRTLGMLALTDIGLGRALAEQFAGQVGLQLLIQVGCLPVYLSTISMGGLSGRQIGMGFVVVVAATVLYTAMGFFAGIVFRRELPLLALLAVLGTLNLWAVSSWHHGYGYLNWTANMALREVLYGKESWESLGVMVGVHLGLAVVLLLAGVLAARRLLLPETESSRPRRGAWLRRWLQRQTIWAKLGTPPLKGGNPVFWREYHRKGGHLRHGLVLVMLGLTITGLIAADVITVSTQELVLLGGVLFCIWASWRLGGVPLADENDGTLPLLLLTRLDSRSLLRAKIWARAGALMPFLIVYGLLTGFVSAVGHWRRGPSDDGQLLLISGGFVGLTVGGSMAAVLVCLGLVRLGMIRDRQAMRVFLATLGILDTVLLTIMLWTLVQADEDWPKVAGATLLAAGFPTVMIWLHGRLPRGQGMASLVGGMPGVMAMAGMLVFGYIVYAVNGFDDDLVIYSLPVVLILCIPPYSALWSLRSGRDHSLLPAVLGNLLLMFMAYTTAILNSGSEAEAFTVCLGVIFVIGFVGWRLLYSRWTDLVQNRG